MSFFSKLRAKLFGQTNKEEVTSPKKIAKRKPSTTNSNSKKNQVKKENNKPTKTNDSQIDAERSSKIAGSKVKQNSNKQGTQAKKQPNSTSEEKILKTVKNGYRQLRIGIDFGTSFSKVVVGVESGGGFVVIKSPNNKENCLFPSVLFYHKSSNSYSLFKKSGYTEISDLKINLIDKLNSAKLSDIYSSEEFKSCAIYLSLLVNHARNYFEENRSDMRRFHLKWGLTLGFPSAPSKKGFKKCEKVFRKLSEVSILLNETKPSEYFSQIDLFLKDIPNAKKKALELVDYDWGFIYPEILSQVVVLNNPDLQINGQQILVDIGAGTVDAVFFSKHKKNKGEKNSIYDAVVEFNGAQKLHENRIKELTIKHPQYTFKGCTPRETNDSTAYAPKNYQDHKLTSLNISTEIDLIDDRYLKKIQTHVFGLFKSVVTECLASVYPGDYKNHSFHLVLSGGGANLDFYQQIKGFPYNTVFSSKIKPQTFPIPADISGLPEKDKQKYYNRLSVAFGLANDPLNLPEIRTKVMEIKNEGGHGKSTKKRRKGPVTKPRKNGLTMCRSCNSTPPIPGSDVCYSCSG